MSLKMIGRLAGVVGLTIALAGCIDVTMDVKVKNAAEAQGVMTTVISSQFYPMIKASATKSADGTSATDDFCKKSDGGVLVENADGSATCTLTKDGKFADLSFDNGKEAIKFTPAGPGLVRVAFPTGEFQSGLNAATSGATGGAAGSDDAAAKAQADQMKAAMSAYFAGHFLTIRIEGGEITDSNMTIAPDKQSAEQKIALTDLLTGTGPKLPDELYAVVKVQ